MSAVQLAQFEQAVLLDTTPAHETTSSWLERFEEPTAAPQWYFWQDLSLPTLNPNLKLKSKAPPGSNGNWLRSPLSLAKTPILYNADWSDCFRNTVCSLNIACLLNVSCSLNTGIDIDIDTDCSFTGCSFTVLTGCSFSVLTDCSFFVLTGYSVLTDCSFSVLTPVWGIITQSQSSTINMLYVTRS